MNHTFFALALICAFFFLFTEAKVLELNAKTFNKEIDEPNTIAIVAFKAQWCGHCKQLAPQFKAAEQAFSADYKPGPDDVKVKFVNVECPDNSDLCGRFGVRGYPTMKVFTNGKDSEYNGGRTKDDIVAAMKSALSKVKPAPKPVELKTQAQLDKCLKSTVCILASLPDIRDSSKKEQDQFIDILAKSAKKNKSFDIQWLYTFARTHRNLEDHLKLGQNGFPAITLLSKRKSIQSPLYRAFNLENINNWAAAAGAGRVSQALPYKDLPPIVEAKDEL